MWCILISARFPLIEPSPNHFLLLVYSYLKSFSINDMYHIKNLLQLLNKIFGILSSAWTSETGGFILRNSGILKMSSFSCRALRCCPTWLFIAWINIWLASLSTTFVTSPWGCIFGALAISSSSTFRLIGGTLDTFYRGMIIWNTRNHKLDRNF